MARRRYQRGSLSQEGTRWVLRWREDVVVEETGEVKRVQQYQTIGTLDDYPTLKLARRAADLVVVKVNALDYRPGRSVRFAEFAERYRANVLLTRKASTQRAAEGHIRRYLIPHFGEWTIDRITQEAVQKFVAALVPKMRRHSIMNICGTLSVMLRTAKKWGYMVGNFDRGGLDLPVDKVPTKRRFFTPEQTVAILNAMTAPKWKAFFWVIASTGIRPSECLGLKVEDLDFDAGLIRVRRSVDKGILITPKSHKAVRDVPLVEDVAKVLRHYLTEWEANPPGLLFPNALGRPYNLTKVVVKRLWPVLDKLGIARCGLHAFRHTLSGTLMMLGTSPKVVQEQLGHEDPSTTLGIYGHLVSDEQRRAVEAAAKILCGNVRNEKPRLFRIK